MMVQLEILTFVLALVLLQVSLILYIWGFIYSVRRGGAAGPGRYAIILLAATWLALSASLILRSVITGHVPFTDMYEFASSFCWGVLFAGLLFLMGLIGLLVRRNVIYMLMSIEVMFNSAGLVFIIAGNHWKQPDGQVMFIFILSVTAVEVAIALALLLQVYHHFKTLDADSVNKLKDNN